ncbi:MAG: hypothetical protein NTZ09_11050 [Candidatus Hydrogenedentes bacterium]|nr:hypothetical protein [Candidatus Hydrogenedentota bacterium]
MRTRRHLAVLAAGLTLMAGCGASGGFGGYGWFLLLAVVMAGAGWPLSVIALRWRKQRRLVVSTYLEAEERLEESEPAEALELVRAAKPEVTYGGLRAPLTQVEMTALLRLGDVAGLLAIYADTPDAFYWQEGPALLVAEAHVADGRYEAFDKLYNWWHEREGRGEGASKRWVLLESDKLQREEYEIGALEALNRGEMEGPAEAGRLARLAVLRGPENGEEAQALIERALKLAPDDPDVRVFQGMLYEKTARDKRAEAAFQYALAYGKRRPLIIDAVAEFYRRSSNIERALEIWMDGLAEPSLDRIWLKVLFLGKVYRPLAPAWKELTPPPGEFSQLIDFFETVPRARFWDHETFQPMATEKPVLLSRQEVHWLRVFEALRVRNEDEALSLLNVSRFGERSWHQDLETTLIWILTYRRVKFMNPELVLIADDRLRVEGRHPLFAALDNWVRGEAKPPEFVQRLVVSDEAFAAACLAAGWHRAGLILHRVPLVKSEAPEWLVRDYEAALKVCKDELDEMRASL